MTTTAACIEVDPTVDPRWSNLLERRSHDLFHSPEWLRVIPATYGLPVRAVVVLDDWGRPEAGLPYCHLHDPRGERITVIPFADYCDPLAETEDQWRRLVEPLLDLGLPISARCLHNDLPLADERFPVAKHARWHGLDIRPTLDELWVRIDSSARRAIRKAERAGVTVRLGLDEADLRSFFNLHLGVRKYKYRLVAQPYRFFDAIREQFLPSGRFALMLAEVAHEVVGAAMYLEWGDTLYYKFSASSLDRLELRPTDLLIWEGIRYARSRGLARVDFGLSDWDQNGLVRYKRKFASSEKAISFLHHASVRSAGDSERQFGALLGQLTDLATDPAVPDIATERAGELLYRFFG